MADFLRFLLLFIAVIGQHSNSFAESRKELRGNADFNHETVIQLRTSTPLNRVDPSRVISLSWRPRVFLYQGFLTDEECDHLISLVIKEAIVGNGDNSRQTVKKRMLASTKLLPDTDDNVITRIEERVAAWTLLPTDNGQSLQVTHYGVEEATAQNLSYFSNQSLSTSKEPLVATLVFYLSNVTHGGQILFPNSEEKNKIWIDCTKSSEILRPIKGNAILFFNLHLNTSPDPSSSHSRCPVQDPEMWVATKLFFLRPTIAGNPPPHQSDSSSDECSDEDDNCQSWAASGECEKNPIYMIGSDDYFGTCRKSCKVC
ncbi:unnamed protein product [Linum tenue]|uniref:procollagen-proline 4-dioxygenase n=1 Tax=Linum tenue TaxID=586396 RepID=A0AAV0QNC7_9ROSI|nr:unnamed protein product [Linum tenue]